MAQKTQVILTDDLDGSEGHETVTFALDGKPFEIDLSQDNAAALREALAPFVEAARAFHPVQATAAPRRRTASRGTAVSPSGDDVAAIRAWAAENGYTVSARGRLSADVRDAYAAAHAAG